MKLLSKIGLYAIALAITRLTLIVLSPVVAYMAGETALGRWGIAVSLAPLFGYLIDLAYARSVVRFFYSGQDAAPADVFRYFLRLRLRLYAGSLVVAVLVAVLGWPILSGGTIAIWPYALALILFGMAEANSYFLTSICRLENRALHLFAIRVGQSVLASLFVLLSLWLDIGIEPFFAFAIAYFAVSIAAMVWVMGPLARGAQGAGAVDIHTPAILKFSLPLTLHDLSWWLRGTAMTIVVANHNSAEITGAFFLAMLAITPFSIFTSGADQALAADYYKARHEGVSLHPSIRSYRLVLGLVFVGAITAMVLIGPVADWIVPAQAQVISAVVPVVLLGVMYHSCYVAWVKSLMYLKRSVTLLAGSAGMSFLGMAAAWLLSLDYGYMAAAWASAGTFAAIAAYALVVSLLLGDEPLDLLVPFTSIVLGTTYVMIQVFVPALGTLAWTAGLALVVIAIMGFVATRRPKAVSPAGP